MNVQSLFSLIHTNYRTSVTESKDYYKLDQFPRIAAILNFNTATIQQVDENGKVIQENP